MIDYKELSMTTAFAHQHCPIQHTVVAQPKTARTCERGSSAISRDPAGVWHIRGYCEAHAILRSPHTKQAGFKAELIERMPQRMNPPILYQEGKAHHEQRRQTARFFTPKATSANYRRLMETLADQLVGGLIQAGRVDLSRLSMTLAVQVAGQVVGLTDSRLPGLDRRLDAFFANDIAAWSWRPQAIIAALRNQVRVAQFFYLDVKPAITARKHQPREDVISHLIGLGYSDSEILTECVTYAAAGMATTREFICIAAWHLLENDALRQRFLTSDEATRHQLLHEILRAEPVVGNLYRRATDNILIESEGVPVIIPAGALIDIDIAVANADERVVGDDPDLICPERELRHERVGAPVLSFGDGHHRCPGAYIAIQESDIFLQRLLQIDGLRIEREPTLTWSELVKGYEVRDFIVAVE
jgi:cytochrome P450